jgi:hypothetical protein
MAPPKKTTGTPRKRTTAASKGRTTRKTAGSSTAKKSAAKSTTKATAPKATPAEKTAEEVKEPTPVPTPTPEPTPAPESEKQTDKEDITIPTAVLPVTPTAKVDTSKPVSLPVKVAKHIRGKYHVKNMFSVPMGNQCIELISVFEHSFNFMRMTNYRRLNPIMNGPAIQTSDVDSALSHFSINAEFRGKGPVASYVAGITSVNDLTSILEGIESMVLHTVKVVKVDRNIDKMMDAITYIISTFNGVEVIQGSIENELYLIIPKGSEAFTYHTVPVTRLVDMEVDKFESQIRMYAGGIKKL